MMNQDTIYAPASGMGKAGLCVIRISGTQSRTILETLAGPLPSPRLLSLRTLKHPHNFELLDEALVAWFPSPRSFTGEDQAELHIHGGLAVREAVLAGLRLFPKTRFAEPGEFARRAFLNQRLDLPQVEGLADLIDAETEMQRRQALRQLGGALSQSCEDWREDFLQLSALIEAMLDFSDEADVVENTAPLFALQEKLLTEIKSFLSKARQGERLREGFVVAILGAPNAGKSSLLNALVGRDAAIVSPQAGTTRDVIEVSCSFEGLPITLIDTAGLRDTQDLVEQEGIKRAYAKARNADLVLWLHAQDGSEDETDIVSLPSSCPVLRVQTKKDLPSQQSVKMAFDLSISIHKPDSLKALTQHIVAYAKEAMGAGDALVTRERHRLALENVVMSLQRITSHQLSSSPELAAEDVRHALSHLGQLTGRVGVEAMLDHLFGRFCIGK